MIALDTIVEELDNYFGLPTSTPDPAFSKYVPEVYQGLSPTWMSMFNPSFLRLFNGLMIRGATQVTQAFSCVFPSEEILSYLLTHAPKGSFLFTHHALDMKCGSPYSHSPAAGFVPIPLHIIDEICKKEISIYSCHYPLDVHESVSTTGSIVESLEGEVTGRFLEYGSGFAGIFCTIETIAYQDLLLNLQRIFDVPYLDCVTNGPEQIRIIAVVAGGGDRVSSMREAQENGCHAYITGHIRHYTNSAIYEERRAEVDKWLPESRMHCIGVSHASSEFLVMKTGIKRMFADRMNLEVLPLPESDWWR